MGDHILKMSCRLMYSFLRPRSVFIRPFIFRNIHEEKQLVVHDLFSDVKDKNKNTYMEMIKLFEKQDNLKRGHVEFIYAALRYMDEYGVNKDLEVYKSLLEVLPKGRFVPTNLLQAEYMHYPKQQKCAVDLLEKMEDNSVMPDSEMETILLNVYGKRGYPLRKYWRMMYWMPKFKNLSPWRLPKKMPTDILEIAKLAIERITSVDNNMKITVFETKAVEASIDHTWIVSAQSPAQIHLLNEELKYLKGEEAIEPLIVRGAYQVRLRDCVVSYFILTSTYRKRNIPEQDLDDITKMEVPSVFGKTDLSVLPESVHEQDDGTILAVCATGTSSRDSLLSWIRLLENNGNSALGQLPVIFTLTAPPTELMKPSEEEDI